jgi:AP-1 complex subunit beta-1
VLPERSHHGASGLHLLLLKKLVYLYLINYAKTQPDLAIMAVNTFVKVSTTTSGPAVGAFAVA